MKKILLPFRKNKLLSEDQLIIKKTIWSFAIFITLMSGAVIGWIQLKNSPLDGGLRGGVQEPVRKVLNANEKLFSTSFDPSKKVKEYPKSAAAKNPRVNGDVGLGDDFDASTWQLFVIKSNGDTLFISLDEIKKLPKTEVIHNFKCIEGWSQVTWWGGVQFKDFIENFHLDAEKSMNYVGLMTPDEAYYVGIDMSSALHPQTLLCYELNGKPLPGNQGFPLRLIIPVKYGIKSIKRIGSMYFDNEKPADYWAERGYDYYSGL